MTVVDLTIEERNQKVIVTVLILTKLSKSDYVSVCIRSGRWQKIRLQKLEDQRSLKSV